MSDSPKTSSALNRVHDVLEQGVKSIPFVARIQRFLTRLGITSSVVFLVPLVVAILWMRYWGLPDRVKGYVQKELEQQGLQVDFQKLLLDPSGGLLADRLTVYRGGEREQVWVQVDRVRIGIGWLSWWRGQPFIQSASIRNASLQIPLGPTESIRLEEMSADVIFKIKKIEVVDARARVLNFMLQLKGSVDLNGRPPARPTTDRDIEYRENLWRSIRKYSSDFEGERPIQLSLEFKTPTLNPENSEATLLLNAQKSRWRGVQIEELGAVARLEQRRLVLEDIHIQLARGEWVAKGEWDLEERYSRIEFQSTLDWSAFAHAFPGKVGEALKKLSFEDPARCSGRLRTFFDPDFRFDLQVDLNWKKFSYGNVVFHSLTIPLAVDSTRLLISGMNLSGAKGNLSLSTLVDRKKPEIQGRLKSTLDPTVFKGVFGEGVDRFLSSLSFHEKGPELDIKVEGNSMVYSDWKFFGKASLEKGSYKKVFIESASSDLLFQNHQLTLTHLKVKRPEGEAKGKIVYDFQDRSLLLDPIVSSVMVRDIATMFGAVFDSYVKPYVLSVPPQVTAQGKIDLLPGRADPIHDLKVQIHSEGVLDYVFLGKTLQFTKPKVELTIQKKILQVQSKSAELFGGKFGLLYKMDLTNPHPDFNASISFQDSDFQQFMKIFYNYDNAKGLMTSKINIAGVLGDFSSFQGDGNFSIRDGYILSIPFLGGLSELLNVVIPNFGYAKADKATMSFQMKEGKMKTEDLDISSAAFTMIGNGGYDFVKDDLDLNMRANVKGVMGLLLFPVSKLFEYHGSGPMKEVKWTPKILD